ncbi:MAG: zinc ribbon domain-containing protein [archaeon]|nr:zinc ribbon domain-containing protein [archaeon]
MTSGRYCTECGNELSPSDRFCPACGATVRECGEPVAPVAETTYARPVAVNGGMTHKIAMLGLLWGIIAVFSGAFVLLDLGSMVDTFIETAQSMDAGNGQNLWEYLLSNGFGRGDVQNIYTILGVGFLVSGACALASAHLTHRRQNHSVALMLMLISALTSAMGMLSLIVGLVVSYYLYKSKDEFES